jgi:hypothetical protein
VGAFGSKCLVGTGPSCWTEFDEGLENASLGLLPTAAIGKLIASQIAKLTAARGATTLYRAVSTAEHADIMATGALRAGQNSYATGKFFAESAEHAAQWGTRLEGAGNFRIIEATFPRSAADQFMRWERLDGIGPARFGTFEQIGNPTIRLWPGSP